MLVKSDSQCHEQPYRHYFYDGNPLAKQQSHQRSAVEAPATILQDQRAPQLFPPPQRSDRGILSHLRRTSLDAYKRKLGGWSEPVSSADHKNTLFVASFYSFNMFTSVENFYQFCCSQPACGMFRGTRVCHITRKSKTASVTGDRLGVGGEGSCCWTVFINHNQC